MSGTSKFSYGSYLNLERILDSQHPLTDKHDELLFIIQHQTSELWMKLAVHELISAKHAISQDDLSSAMKMLARVSRIFEQLNAAWDVLRTLTPDEYTTFRDAFGAASGFQSWQYREIEFLAGNKAARHLETHKDTQTYARLESALKAPSLYDEAIALLSRNSFEIDSDHLTRDVTLPYHQNKSVRDAWLTVYQHPKNYWGLFELAEKLVDFEDYFRRWRFNHVTTVQRVIGFKRGSGGSSGVNYLKAMLDVVLFPELWDIRTEL
ncbi:tryptophan 2,3-dioxygenase [Hellea balneolensis]|uniref:tryptophan 2,3-dioxygenase n=1 Tax=Hellea balneolensis TaxID=287478 RepID=UPI00047C0D93|nr:tryptophan 2,3-dioxygenase [Hellea balneolensis]